MLLLVSGWHCFWLALYYVATVIRLPLFFRITLLSSDRLGIIGYLSMAITLCLQWIHDHVSEKRIVPKRTVQYIFRADEIIDIKP